MDLTEKKIAKIARDHMRVMNQVLPRKFRIASVVVVNADDGEATLIESDWLAKETYEMMQMDVRSDTAYDAIRAYEDMGYILHHGQAAKAT